jgi:hypothetical protein
MAFPPKFSQGDVLIMPFFRNQEDKNGQPRWVICVEDLQDKMIIIPMTSQIHQQRH